MTRTLAVRVHGTAARAHQRHQIGSVIGYRRNGDPIRLIGGSQTTAEPIADQLARIGDLTDDELALLLQQVQDEFDAATEPGAVDVDGNPIPQEAIVAYGDAADAVRAEQTARAEAQAERDAAVEAARARVHGSTDDEGGGEGEGEGTTGDGEGAGESGDGGEGGEGGTTGGEGEGAGGTDGGVTASAPPAAPAVPSFAQIRAIRNAGLRSGNPARRREATAERAIVTVTAAADLGLEDNRIRSRRDLVNAIRERSRSMAGTDSTQAFRVATQRTQRPDRFRMDNDLGPQVVTRKLAQLFYGMTPGGQALAAGGATDGYVPSLEEAMQELRHCNLQALAAAGGFYAPPTPYYEELVIATNDRPEGGALTTIDLPRGALTIVPPPSIAQFVSGVGTWTVPNDQAATAGTPTKNIIRIPVGSSTLTFTVRAVTARAIIGNLAAMADPELVEQGLTLLDAAWARLAENDVLADYTALSTDFLTTDHYLGATRDLLADMLMIAASYRQKHRMPNNATLEIHGVPIWVQDVLKADLIRSLAVSFDNSGGQYNVTDQQLEDWLAAKNLRVSWTIDGQAAQIFGNASTGYTPGTSATPKQATRFPQVARWWICAPGTLARGDMGELRISAQRDTAVNSTNDFTTLYEGLEVVMNLGVDLWQVDSTLIPDGASSAAVAASAYDAGTKTTPTTPTSSPAYAG